MTELISESDAVELARATTLLGPDTLALARSGDALIVSLRDEQLTVRRRRLTGSAVDFVDGDQHRHLFSGDCSPTGILALVQAAGRPEGTARPTAIGQPARLPDRVVTAMPALARKLADRMLSGTHPALQPVIGANASRARIEVFRPDGTVARDDRLHLELRIGARVHGTASTARAMRVVSGNGLDALLKGHRHLAAVDEVARVAVERLDAVDPPEGELPVVLGPASPAALLHEVCGHGLEVDIAGAPGGAYHPPLGRPVASTLVTVVDDPGMPGWAPLYQVDDEGLPASATVLVDAGTLAGYLSDRAGAGRGWPATGNGRRLDHTHPALARMSCTYLAAGAAPAEAALAGVRRGLYVRSIVAGETNMSGGEFTADVTESFLIENGRITAPVRAATLHGRGTDVLRQIDVVCDDLDFLPYGFQCNKLNQFPLTVSVGQPTIRVARMDVGG